MSQKNSPYTDTALAKRLGEHLSARKSIDDLLGIKLLEIDAGYVKMSMTVTDEMTNFFGSTHGGAVFALADSAFALSCNSHNKVTVAAGCSIEYLRPSFPGDTLTATAHFKGGAGRQGIFDIEINNQDGVLVAVFRGKSHSTKDSILPDEETETQA
ncbi:hydroxyphenylacetyl-CoA thioesterase PaaI [Emcibacter nanhaiensis]|uniref:Hydroxyphenylacetyl-CoA thioesterase PaaI n=1 Tax=Emcibacter nanhaiensis TaxID=1505037 RepID=A0A501PBG0_9PROT|nr:hydroxyphenylacetyl-CoA thioesterase PaaI [Emcibacter nanhaiensis]TPD57538.1 hydroxyphenylacetyl-CoA thioesterase PaaI [Emcibacter nanhaiensis]